MPKPKPKIDRTLDPEPLVHFVRTTTGTDVVDLLGISRNAWWRYKGGQKIHYLLADRYAIALGVHPMDIWGDDWLTVIQDAPSRRRK